MRSLYNTGIGRNKFGAISGQGMHWKDLNAFHCNYLWMNAYKRSNHVATRFLLQVLFSLESSLNREKKDKCLPKQVKILILFFKILLPLLWLWNVFLAFSPRISNASEVYWGLCTWIMVVVGCQSPRLAAACNGYMLARSRPCAPSRSPIG